MNIWRLIRNQWDRTLAVVVSVGGVLAVVLGWVGVSGKSLPAAQIPYVISGAIFGLCLLGVGATLWLSADLRDEWHKLDEIQRDIRSGGLPPTSGNVLSDWAPGSQGGIRSPVEPVREDAEGSTARR